MASSSITGDRRPPVLEARAISRVHGGDRRPFKSVDAVSLVVDRGDVVALTGPSGSGKTSLLHLLGGLDRPDSGSVLLCGTDWASLPGDKRATFRRRRCGYVVQGASLLPQATAAENVEIPLLLDSVDPETRQFRSVAALRQVGLAGQEAKLPRQLSMGQQQRVAIARALVMGPAVLLADEPTGNLDATNAEAVMDLLLALTRQARAAVVLVTHDPRLSARADRVLRLHSGRLRDPDTSGS